MSETVSGGAGGVDFQALRETFLAESAERLLEIEEALLALERQPEDPELLHTVFRGMHTLKGDASTVGLPRIAELAHHGEDLLERIRAGTFALADAASTLFSTVDTLRRLLDAAAHGDESEPPELAPLLAELGRLTGDHTPRPLEKKAATAFLGMAGAAEPLRTLRIAVAKLDRLLDLTGEIAVARGRLRQTLAELPPRAATEAVRAFEEADPLYLELQELVIDARLVPVGPIFRQQARLVRDVAAAQGKRVRLVLDDHDVSVDTKVVEHIRAPLAHLVRNAIDHGIEPPAAREAAGKDAVGTVRLSAFHQGAFVIIQVADDGGGFDRERIAHHAAERGLLGPDRQLSDREIDRLVLMPGFSTAEAVTEISGRGVGLDVVAKNIEALRGSIDFASVQRKGTTFTIRVPLTLAVIEGFAVAVGGEVFLFPLEEIRECVDLPAGRRGGPREHDVMSLRGAPLPLLRLRHWLGETAPADARESVVVVGHQGGQVGLVVDRLLGAQQTVVKPLAEIFRGVPGLLGTTVLGDGRVAFILDIPALLAAALAAAAEPSSLRVE